MSETVAGTVALKRVDYCAVVRGLFAEVTVEQKFRNDGEAPVEVAYVFPLPDAAAVNACTMQIGDRTITAELKRRKQAVEEYEEAVEEGHHAALATQERPNVFTMNVGGIERGETAIVTLTYVQEVPWHAGGGRFRIPLVVAPRFIPAGIPDADRITPPVSASGVPYVASVTVDIAPGFFASVASPTHPQAIEPMTISTGVGIDVRTGDIQPDRDFILVYRSLAEKPEVAVHQGTHEDEHFALLQVLPTTPAVAHDADILFLLDISGSMRGGKIEGLRTIVKRTIRDMVESGMRHRIGVILFDNEQTVLAPLGTPFDEVLAKVDTIKDHGSTYLGPALDFTFAQFDDAARPKYVLLVTDGQTEALNFTAAPGIRVIAAGIDTAVNDTALRTVAEATNGVTEWFYPGEDFDHVARRLLGLCSPPVLRDLTVTGNGVSEKEVVGQSYVAEGCPTTLAIRFKKSVPQHVMVTGTRPDGTRVEWQVALPAAELAMSERRCDFAPALWAREKLRLLTNDDASTDMSLRYGILSPQTAFVAVSEKKVPGAKPIRQEIPVALPHGWEFESQFAGGGGPVCLMAIAGAGAFLGGGGPVARGAMDGGIDSIDSLETAGGSLGAPPQQPLPLEPPFTLDAAHPADLVVALVAGFDSGRFSMEEQEQGFNRLLAFLQTADIASWSDTLRARTRYFLVRLMAYCEDPLAQNEEEDKAVLDAALEKLTVSPPASPLALAWVELEKFMEGNSSTDAFSFPPDVNGDWEFIRWVVGLGPRPATGPWAPVATE